MVQQKEIDIIKIISIIKENKKFIGVSTLLTTLAAILYAIFAMPIYTAKAIINPPKLTDAGTSFSQVISGLQGLASGGGGLLSKTDTDVVIGILKTNSVKDMVIKKFNLMEVLKEDNIENVRSALTASVAFIPDMKSGFLEIDVDSPNPKTAAAIANYYTEVLGQRINDIAFGRANQKYKFYEEQLKVALLNLNQSESDLKSFAKRNGIIAGQQSQIIAALSAQFQARLVISEAQLQSMSYFASSENSDVQAVQAQIDSYKSQLDSLNNQNQADSNSTIPTNIAPELAAQYAGLMRDFTFKELVYGVLLKQAKASQLDSQSEMVPLSIQVIDPATVPYYKSKPRRAIVCLTGMLFGIIASIFYLIVRYRKRFVVEAVV